MNKSDILEAARAQIRAEGEVLMEIADQIDESFIEAVGLVANCTGKILATGAGTSGTMARRLAHLLATCGMSAFYQHPGEALHGPLAAIGEGDVIIALSKAGKSQELNTFCKVAKERGAKVMAWTWYPDSPLGQLSDVVLQIRPDEKGEGEGVLPFGSTLANGAVGDALTLAAKQMRGFDLHTLTQTHPSGATSELVR
ncbi:MAG: SIS domain-containing protein [Caldilineaceae bacterium]|nr:SIS domain-containing protein [Caldilineaceae bacterium]MBP8124673.1 SIS domain-containing protein [Caldilineaceae bacterium]MBP9073925.1 SIS domain-containing protein [Caldilineaceae bacterium]